jgi:transcriptional regulator with XRE-family HTH domain
MTEIAQYPFFPRCLECGGEMKLTTSKGRTRELVKGVHLPIPDDFPIPTCSSCGEEVWAPEMTEVLDALLSKQLGGMIRGYVEHIGEKFGVTQAQIGMACRVDRTYLSHVTAGRKTPSGTLVELLQLFADVDGAFEHAFPEAKREPSSEPLDREHIVKLVRPVQRTLPFQESATAGTFTRQPTEWKGHLVTEALPVAANGN